MACRKPILTEVATMLLAASATPGTFNTDSTLAVLHEAKNCMKI